MRCLVFLALVAALCPPASARVLLRVQEHGEEEHEEAAEADEEEDEDEPEERRVETLHRIEIDGTPIDYRAVAGTLVLRAEPDEAKASVFHVAYTRLGVEDLARRPVTFCFNGGPGSSSVWLHLGAFGPRRVDLSFEGIPGPPPYRLVDNEHSLLDLTDLVFVDPPTTGYSRAVEGEDAEQFHGFEEDVQWMAEFIRLWTTREGRWGSPKLLAGESYGTTRAAGLAAELQDRHGMYLNGLVLVSSILEFQTARFDVGNDLPHVLFLPTYTATAWYHDKLEGGKERALGDWLAEAEAFALGDYLDALMAGDRLGDERRGEIARRVARLTGLSPEYVERAKLRVGIRRFVKELGRDQFVTVGRLDSRYLGADRDAAGEGYEYDPSYAAIQGPFTGALNHYVRAELEYEEDLPYEILTRRVHPWSYASSENRYLNVAEPLRRAMTRNSNLHVFVACGYYDLATPYFATRYTFDHLALERPAADHVTLGFYEAGHMMYVRQDSRDRLKRDLRAFYAAAVPE